MPQPNRIEFTFRELVELMIKDANIHEGIWAVSFRFGIQGANIGTTDEPGEDARPAAIVPIVSIALDRVERESALAVDAAKVNPKTE